MEMDSGMSASPSQPVPRWLHAWAVLTVVVAAAAVTMGAVVTTFRVGMADPVWPTYPWHLLLISWDEPSPGFIIEHAHRLAAYTAGFCAIVLALGLWFAGPRRLALIALGCVVAQGLLGGARVLLNAKAGPEIAAVHGVFAQLVFSLFVCLAVLTAPRRVEEFEISDYAHRCRRASLVLAGLAFAQLVLGALVRHTHDAAAVRLHVLNAFAVVAGLVWLMRTTWEQPAGRLLLGRPLFIMACLIVLQIGMGVEALLGEAASDLPPDLQPIRVGQAAVRTGHVVVGAFVLASAVVAALQAHRAAVLASAEEAPVIVPTSQQVRGAL